MSDDVNRGDESDRLLVSWALASPPHPTPVSSVVATVAIPADIAAVRASSAADAARWRREVREAFLGHLADGLVVGGFDDERGYLFVEG